jgi:hypothetical protein
MMRLMGVVHDICSVISKDMALLLIIVKIRA